jgi:hypothetical protein
MIDLMENEERERRRTLTPSGSQSGGLAQRVREEHVAVKGRSASGPSAARANDRRASARTRQRCAGRSHSQ